MMLRSSPKSGRLIDSPLTKIRLSILDQGFECMAGHVVMRPLEQMTLRVKAIRIRMDDFLHFLRKLCLPSH